MLTEAPDPGSGIAPRLPSLEVEGAPGALSLEKLDVRVKVAGRLARTEVTQVFRSSLARISEGTYEMVLPDGAVISRLAMDVEGKMTEGELAEKERARQIYESIVRRQKDPALLEWQGGNRFKMQVFPIPALGTKTVILEYEELLPTRARATRYSFAMPALDESNATSARIGAFSFELLSSATGAPTVEPGADGYAAFARVEGTTASMAAQQFVARGPIRVSFAAPRMGSSTALAGEQGDERFFVLDVAPSLPAPKASEPRDLVLAIDTSRGIGDRELARAIEVARTVVRQSPQARVVVVTADLDARTCREAFDACVTGLRAGGATHLEAMFDHAAGAARQLERPGIVILSDGVASVGELDGDVLIGRFVKALEDSDHTITTVAIGHEPDTGFLAKLAAKGRGHNLRMSPLADVAQTANAVVQALGIPLVLDVSARAQGFDVELVDRPAVHLRPGEPLAVLGRMGVAPFEVTIEGWFQGAKLSQTVRVDPSALPTDKLVTHFWARGHIEQLERRATPRKELVAASLKYGVMSKATSFLVLENDEAYRRFGVERLRQGERDEEANKNLAKTAASLQSLLGDSATGDAKRVRAAKEQEWKPASPPAGDARASAGMQAMPEEGALMPEPTADAPRDAPRPAAAARPKSIALDSAGDGGAASAEVAGLQRLFGAKADDQSARASLASASGHKGRGADRDVTMTQGTPVIMGSLDKELIRRIVQTHASQIRYCYEKELTRTPGIFGKVVMKWVINGEGKVTQAQTAETQMKNANVEGCLATKIKTWLFPKPKGGGIVIVNYPFVFKTGFTSTPQLQVVEPVWEDEIVALRRKVKAAKPGTDEELQARSELFSLLFSRGELPEADREWAFIVGRLKTVASGNETLLVLLADRQRCSRYRSECSSAVRAAVLNQPEDWRVTSGSMAGYAPEAFAEALIELARSGKFTARHVDALLRAGIDQGGYPEGYRLVRQACSMPSAPARHCINTLAGDSSPEGQSLRASLQPRVLDTLFAERSEDLLDVGLLLEEVRWREATGDIAGARRTLSEIVEFAPHELTRRMNYVEELERRSMFVEACEARGHLAALDPTRRDEFRSMMRLRRQGAKLDPGPLRECIVKAVSRLPVQRDLSLVLTWEDPAADVDLHVITPSGEEVFFQHREGRDGGLLYYDVTDGFGPEIYTLGGAEKGTYKIQVVYYRGTAEDVRGTLSILEHAGTAGETRRDVEFVLDEEDYDDADTVARVRL